VRPRSLIATALAIGCASVSGPGEGGESEWRAIGDASVVAYTDATFGRDALNRLLRATSTVDALTMQGTVEPALLEACGASQR
jgi:hypothetical protein